MSERYFVPSDVEALIPRLAALMGRVMAAHGEAGAARDRLREEQQRIALAGGGVIDRAAWRADAERVERCARQMEAGLKEIHDLGGVPKDLALGLVDFPHLRDGRVVNLCWKYGEEAIRYWHGMDEGYGSRKPL